MCILPWLRAKASCIQWYRERRLLEIFFYWYWNRQLPLTLVHLWELCNVLMAFLLSLIFLLLFLTCLLLHIFFFKKKQIPRIQVHRLHNFRNVILLQCSLSTPLESVMGPSYLILAKQNKYAGPMIFWPYIGLNSLLEDMIEICDQHRAIRNHYETTVLPVIYQAVSNYFLWGCVSFKTTSCSGDEMD